jgi:hypothetical protein
MILTESNILEIINLPTEPNELAIFKIAGLIIACAVLVSIPILPFSATYRIMFGVEIPLFHCRKSKIRKLIIEEIQLQTKPVQQPLQEDSLVPPSEIPEAEISEKAKDLVINKD